MGRIGAFVGILAATSLIAATASDAAASGRDLTGRPAPEIHVQQGLDGLPTGCTLQSLRGHVVVLKFWFPGCGACRRQLPGFQSLCDQYRARGVQFIGVAFADGDEVLGFLRQNGYTFPCAVDPDGITSSRYGVVSYPTTYVIGADGIVKSYDDLSAGLLERELRTTPSVLPATVPARRAEAPASREVDRNVAELGEVPAPLASVRDAAARNDYGEVARLVRDHFDVGREGRTVVEAAGRIENLARRRWTNRAETIRSRWNDGDTHGAWEDIRRLAQDFRATKFGDATIEWSERFERDGTYPPIYRTWDAVPVPASGSTTQPAAAVAAPERAGTRPTSTH